MARGRFFNYFWNEKQNVNTRCRGRTRARFSNNFYNCDAFLLRSGFYEWFAGNSYLIQFVTFLRWLRVKEALCMNLKQNRWLHEHLPPEQGSYIILFLLFRVSSAGTVQPVISAHDTTKSD